MKTNMIRMKWLIALWVTCGLFMACSDEELEPSNIDSTYDFYVIPNDPNADALDRLRYDIYAATNTSVFYNDTLGVEVRVGLDGVPYNYYEKYRLGYIFTYVGGSYIYTLSEDRELLHEFLKMYNERVHSVIAPSRLNMKGILLVDSLLQKSKGYTYSFYRDKPNSMLTVALLRAVITQYGTPSTMGVPFKEMSAEEKTAYMDEMLLGIIIEGFKDFSAFSEKNATIPEMIEFYSTTLNATTYPKSKESFYGKTFNTEYNILANGKPNADSVGMEIFDSSEPRRFGVLRYKRVTLDANGNEKTRSNLNNQEDAQSFIDMIHAKTDAEIREEHAAWPLVLKKYECMIKTLRFLGLEGYIKKE